MSTMLALHEVPAIIRVCSQRPSAKIGFDAGTTVECGIGMAIVVREIEEAVDASIEGDGQTLWYSLPAVIALDEEEAAFVIGIGFAFVRHDSAIQAYLMPLAAPSVSLCLIEMSVPAGVFLHVAVGIQSPIALQLAHD